MMLMLLCTSAWAETKMDELNRELTGVTGTNYTDWSYTAPSGAVYAGNSAGGNYSIQLRSKNSDSGIVTTASGGKVKTVDITFDDHTVNGRVINIYGKNTAYSSPTDLYDENTQGDLLGTITYGTNTTVHVSGDYQFIGIRSKSDAAFLSKIDITWEKVTPPAVETPVITFDPAAPYQGDVVTCSISCTTDGAAIQYSTNGENYSNYPDGGFTLTENTTVYAKATRGADVSEVAQKSITFTPITTVANIAALNQLADGTVFRMTGSATVVYVYGNSYVYIKDESGSTLLYDVNKNYPVEVGNTISNLQGVVSYYNGLFEVGKPASYTVEQTSITVDPVVMAVSNITTDNVNQYVKLEGVSLSEVNPRS